MALVCYGAKQRTVALTFDDLPAAGAADPSVDSSNVERMNAAVLGALKRHHATAIGFVNEKTAERLGHHSLDAWQRNGYELGNHTYSHPDFDALTVAEFEQDVIRGEASLAKSARYFRFPFNHAGDTVEKQAAAALFLAGRGYQLAVCTIDNEDYEFSRAYDLMRARKDGKAALRLRDEYVAYTGSKIEYYSGLHRQVFGREIPHVMLLHLNHLNADVLDRILDTFEKQGYRYVPLDQAQADPAYRTPVPQATSFGPMWGYRWATALGIKVDGSREPEPPRWVLRYGLD